MTESTYVKVSDAIDATPLPPVVVKGIDEPITIYRVNDM
jgi:class 3 adenylate cyclase